MAISVRRDGVSPVNLDARRCSRVERGELSRIGEFAGGTRPAPPDSSLRKILNLTLQGPVQSVIQTANRAVLRGPKSWHQLLSMT